jgi:manganese/iron transport system substrate-binding protein
MKLAAVLFAAIATVSLADEPRRKVVVCSTTQVADFARQVGGDRFQVRCILAPGSDPHTYQPTPGDAEIVSRADLCLENGLHLEGKDWMKELAKNSGKPCVACAESVEPLDLEQDGQRIHDPHAWFSPVNAAKYVNAVTRALIQLEPAGKDEFEARAELALQELKTLDAWIRKQVNQILPERRVLVTSHDAFNYFAREYGFKVASPVGWSTGTEVGAGMTPERRKQVVESIRSFGVKAVFVETSVNPKLVREIAEEAGVAIGGELYSDSMGGPGTAGETYTGMMRENVITIVRALK